MDRSDVKYEEYKALYDHITDHRKRILEAYEKRLRNVILSEYGDYVASSIQNLLYNHDNSRLTELVELIPYSRYFSNPESCPKSSDLYRKGWNHHQKTNPHHWQYWVILEDECNPKISALPMDLEYVIEMLCDWQAASDYYGNTVHNWWETQKCNMILHHKTVELIEKYLVYMN